MPETPLPKAEALEVLCKLKAYYVKRPHPESQHETKCGQVSWSKFDGPEKAWEQAKTFAGV